MENLFNHIFKQLCELIVVPYLLVLLLVASKFKDPVQTLIKRITKKELGHTYVVLILATILVTPFIFFADYGWENLLLTYTLGTSFYELFLKKIKNLK